MNLLSKRYSIRNGYRSILINDDQNLTVLDNHLTRTTPLTQQVQGLCENVTTLWITTYVARWGFEPHFVALPLSLPTHLSTAMIKKFFSLKNLPRKKKVSIIPPLLNIEFIIMSPAL